MRFLIIVKATKDSEAGVMPEDRLITQMATYHEELARAGALLDASGLQPSTKGRGVRYSGGKQTVMDGPFAETKGLIAGYTLIQVNSREEALAWTKRFPNPAGGRQGRGDRGAPAVRAGGLRSQRVDRAVPRHGGWLEEVGRAGCSGAGAGPAGPGARGGRPWHGASVRNAA